MKAFKLGDFEIHKIVEAEAMLPLEAVFQDARWEGFKENASWLAPEGQDPQIEADLEAMFLSFHSYVMKTPYGNILVDACLGNDKDRGGAPPFHMRSGNEYLTQLEAIGLSVDDIDYVMCTHLHADHVGWNTRLIDGRWVPTFPNARYVMSKVEFDHWEEAAKKDPDGAWQEASYFDSVLPVVEAGQVDLVKSDFELHKGIWLEPMPGHSPGNAAINIQSGEQKGVFTGDTIHHAVQVAHPEWLTQYCYDPVVASETRAKFIDRVADTDTLILPAHFRGLSVGHICGDGAGCRFDFKP